MIKRLFLITLLIIVAAALFGCGGDSTSSTPVGVNPGVASRVELMATSNVNQTNSYCYFKAKVIDGNGQPMRNWEVIFTNLSLTGVLDHTTAVTGTNGIATVTLYSTISGFATVQAEVNAGTEKIRDRKTVFFSSFDMAAPGGNVTSAGLVLDVDSDNDGIFNETSDFILFEPAGKSDAIVRATVTGSSGAPVLNSAVTFGADSPEVTFPLGSPPAAPVVHTNGDGQASVLVRVSPTVLRTTDSTVNITALADNNTFNVVTLFLKPILVDPAIIVTAVPTTILPDGTSVISATVKTTAGTPVPDGTAVNFAITSGGGSIVPFSQTTVGVATATYTAPTITFPTLVTIKASVGGASGSTTVLVDIPAVVLPPVVPVPAPAIVAIPAAVTIHCGGASIATITITAGTPPFNVIKIVSTDPVTLGGIPVLAVGGQFTVTGTACGPLPPSSTANLLITDSQAKTFTVVVTVTNP
jgi:hypothetical protein